MKYFIDTEFIEGFWNAVFYKNRHFIDLISIGIVAEDGRSFHSVSKEYNYNDADDWVKKNVIQPLYVDTVHGDARNRYDVHNFHKEYGLSNKQIADEIRKFVNPLLEETPLHDKEWNDHLNKFNVVAAENRPIEFYGYYADYDWVLFCSLFGRMIDLPKGFPMYCRDLKQMLDEKLGNYSNANAQKSKIDAKYTVEIYNMPVSQRLKWVKETIPQYPAQENEHNALADAQWNKKLYYFINSL